MLLGDPVLDKLILDYYDKHDIGEHLLRKCYCFIPVSIIAGVVLTAELESVGDFILVGGKLSNRAILRDILTWAPPLTSVGG